MKYLFIMALIFALQACTESTEPPALQSPPQSADDVLGGRVSEVIAVDSYVYMKVETERGDTWIATTPMDVQTGDVITAPQGMLMENFHSSALNRTFEQVYFVDAVTVSSSGAMAGTPPVDETHALPPGHPAVPQTGQGQAGAAGDIEPLEGGMTVADIYAAYPGIDGQQITVRGKVLKFSTGIMGANWVTLQDGTGTEPDNILVAKTQETVNIGDTVTVTGTAKADVSLGYGYDYKVLVEDASFSR